MIGGGSDREQAIATKSLSPLIKEIKAWIEDGVAGLTICGGYQFLGEYLQTNSGQKLKGMGIFPFFSKAGDNRLMTNLLVESHRFDRLVGFENHSGRTYHDFPTLGKVIKGFGNNEDSSEEGLFYNNLIGTYMHGPILPKNPTVADFLIAAAVERKSGRKLEPLDDQLEMKAKHSVWHRFSQSQTSRFQRLLRKKTS